VLNESVGEVESPRCVAQFPYQRRGTGAVENVEQLVLRGLRRHGQELKIEVPTDHGSQGQHALGISPEPCNPATDDLAHAVRQGRAFQSTLGHPPAGVVLVHGSGF